MVSRSLLLLLVLLPGLLHAQPDTASLPAGTEHYVNTRERTHATLQDQFVQFSLDYPKEWSLQTSLENPSNFVQIAPPRSLMALTTSGDVFALGPVTLSQIGTHEQNMRSARGLVELLERQLPSSFLRYQREFAGVTNVDGLEGYEVRYSAQPKSKGNIPAGTVFGRFIVVPTEKDHGGFVLMMLTDSGAGGVNRSGDVGTVGSLGSIFASLKVVREPQKTAPPKQLAPLPAAGDTGTVHYRQTRELLPEDLSTAFVPFEFDYPAYWRLTPGKQLGNTFVQVSRIIDVRGDSDFSAEAFSVGSVTFLFPNDSVRRALLQQITEMVDGQFGQLFSSYQRQSEGAVVIGGVEGYEIRGMGHKLDSNFEDVAYYLRLVALPPTNSRAGLIIAAVSCSLTEGIRSAEDVGERGDLGLILRSFRVLEE